MKKEMKRKRQKGGKKVRRSTDKDLPLKKWERKKRKGQSAKVEKKRIKGRKKNSVKKNKYQNHNVTAIKVVLKEINNLLNLFIITKLKKKRSATRRK